MADAKKCDRCGKLFEPYIKSDGRLNPDQYTEIMVRDAFIGKSSYNNDGYFDLCSECSESLDKWIKFFKEDNVDNEQ